MLNPDLNLVSDFETRLRKLIPMLGSPNEPEAHAALRKVNALLRQHGRDWHWITGSVGAKALSAGAQMMQDMEERMERERAEERRQRPADAETQKAAAFVLTKGRSVANMHPENVATFERAAAGGMVTGLERDMILQSAKQWRGRDVHKLDVEYKKHRTDPFWLAGWLLRANDPGKPFSQSERAFVEGVIKGGIRPDDVERLNKLERRVLRQRPRWNEREGTPEGKPK